ncbi:uncharacterized protein LOC119101644 isoform X3 [Pollicipes pollicipes]|nr:uncharacterized protein LOC119101644 isoform X3 [Pollicipes pollicipes]
MILRRAMRKAGLPSVKRTILHLAKGYLGEPGGGDGGRRHASGGNMGGDGDTGDTEDLAMPSIPRAFHSPITSQATREPADVAWTPSAFTPGGSQGSASTPDQATTLDAAVELEQISPNMEVETAEEEDVNVGATEEDGRHWGTRSAVVSEPQLRELAEATAVLCTRCGARCGVNVTRITVSFTVTWECKTCATVANKWVSTPKEGHTMVIDTLLVAAVVLSGSHLEKLNKLLAFANIGQLSRTAYSRITQIVVAPVIEEAFNRTLTENREAALVASPDGLVVAGNRQSDGPGFSATYGCYAIMDHTTGHIIAQNTMCREEVGFSSPKLEVEGLSRCLSDLEGMPIKEFVSDQHLGVRKVVRQRLPGVQHSYNVRHAAKNVAKRLRQHAAKATNRALRPWVRHVKNHFWWCAQTSHGDVDVFKKRWMMIINHVVNIHATPSGLNRCHHADVPEGESREPPWLLPGSSAHNALWEVVASYRTLNLAAFVVNYRRTDNLEVFHAASLEYTPKPKYFAPLDFVTRKRAAVLDWSAHRSRDYARDEEGNVKTSRVSSRVSDQYIVRPVKAPKTFPHVRPLLEAIVDRRMQVAITGPSEALRWGTPPRAPRTPGRQKPGGPGGQSRSAQLISSSFFCHLSHHCHVMLCHDCFVLFCHISCFVIICHDCLAQLCSPWWT